MQLFKEGGKIDYYANEIIFFFYVRLYFIVNIKGDLKLKKSLKKMVSLVLVLALSFTICVPAFATEKTKISDYSSNDTSINDFSNLYEMLNDKQFVKQQENKINKELGINQQDVQQYRDWLNNSQESGYFKSDSKGHIVISPEAENLIPTGLKKEYVSRLDSLNKLIDIGIYSFNEESGIVSHALECIKDPSIMKDCSTDTQFTYNLIYATNEDLDLGWQVHQNFQEIKNIYRNVATYPAAVAYWVNKVRKNGDWDYKVKDIFKHNKTYWCKYGPGGSSRGYRNGEWIGNYNYGYTGHLLFNLDVLHVGSSAVGGGPEKDKHDWPAIDSGYNHSGTIEW